MLMSKKARIRKYLEGAQAGGQLTPFDSLLQGYISGELQDLLSDAGLRNVRIYVDFLPLYKCIDIQGRSGSYYVNIQIESDCFAVSFDMDEPDEFVDYKLTSSKHFYNVVKQIIKSVGKHE